MKKFIMDMLERVIKTAVQTAVAAIGTTATIGNINWTIVASTVGMASVLSILSSLASRFLGDKDSASMVKAAVMDITDNILNVVLNKNEEASSDTLEELSNGKGEDENE